jgi:hypothetical protein
MEEEPKYTHINCKSVPITVEQIDQTWKSLPTYGNTNRTADTQEALDRIQRSLTEAIDATLRQAAFGKGNNRVPTVVRLEGNSISWRSMEGEPLTPVETTRTRPPRVPQAEDKPVAPRKPAEKRVPNLKGLVHND